MVRVAGVEPTTCGFGGRHSIQLSYARTVIEFIMLHNLLQQKRIGETMSPSAIPGKAKGWPKIFEIWALRQQRPTQGG